MATEKENTSGFEEGDRVKRSKGIGCQGDVVKVRTEVTKRMKETETDGWIVEVQWDNGTLSMLAPEALEKV